MRPSPLRPRGLPGPAGRFFAAALFATTVGCSPSQGSPGLPAEPVGLAFPLGSTMTAEELRNRLMAFADQTMGELARASAMVLAADSTPSARSYAQLLQAQVAAASLVLAVEPDPESALQDLMVTIAAERASLGSRTDHPVGSAAWTAFDAALGRLETEVWAIGEVTYAPEEIAALRARLKTRMEAGTPMSPTGIVRVADLPTDGGPALSKGLFAPIAEANRQIEETRVLGERFLFLAERLPVITLWQAEAVTWEVLAAPEARRAFENLTLVSSTLEGLLTEIEGIPTLLDDQREALLAAFDEREGVARELMVEAGALVADAEPLVEAGRRATESLATALASMERTVQSLRDENAPGGAAALDIAAYDDALADFRAAAEALNESLARVAGLASAPREVIDHAALRAAQLLLLVFALLVAYRLVPRWLDRKS